MERSAHYFWVGLVVTLLILGMIGFLIWSAGKTNAGDYRRYTIYFTDPIRGLVEGADVQYKGVTVGKVLDTRLSRERHDLIKVDIEVEKTTPVRAGTEVRLSMMGITGLVYVELATKNFDDEPPVRLPGERYPVLHGTGSQLYKFVDEIPEITERVKQVADKIVALLDDKNMAAISATLENVEEVSADVNDLLSDENIAHASDALRNISESSGELPEIMEQVRTTTSEINDAARRLSALVRNNEAYVNEFAGEGLAEMTVLAQEARKMAETIREAAEKIGENPSQLIYQPGTDGVEIPQ